MPLFNQASFILGERRTNQLTSSEYSQSVEELKNFYVLKNGALKRRAGTRLEKTFNKRDAEILDFQLVGGVYIIHYSDNELYALFPNDSFVQLQMSDYMAFKHNLTDGNVTTFVYDFDQYLINKTLTPTRIVLVNNKVWVLVEDALPQTIEVIDGELVIRPYYMKTNNLSSYKDVVRAIPIEDEPVVFTGVLSDSDDIKLIVDRLSDLDNHYCKAWLGVAEDKEDDIGNINVDKMSLREFIGKPLIFSVLPSDLQPIRNEVEQRFIRSDTAKEGENTVSTVFEQINDWGNTAAYVGTLLQNLQTQSDIANFSFNERYGEGNNILATRTTVINELLYGRKYMIIPYETVVEDTISPVNGEVSYLTAYPKAEVTSPAVTTSTLNSMVLAEEDVEQERTGFDILISNKHQINSEYTETEEVDLGSTLTISGLQTFGYDDNISDRRSQLEYYLYLSKNDNFYVGNVDVSINDNSNFGIANTSTEHNATVGGAMWDDFESVELEFDLSETVTGNGIFETDINIEIRGRFEGLDEGVVTLTSLTAAGRNLFSIADIDARLLTTTDPDIKRLRIRARNIPSPAVTGASDLRLLLNTVIQSMNSRDRSSAVTLSISGYNFKNSARTEGEQAIGAVVAAIPDYNDGGALSIVDDINNSTLDYEAVSDPAEDSDAIKGFAVWQDKVQILTSLTSPNSFTDSIKFVAADLFSGGAGVAVANFFSTGDISFSRYTYSTTGQLIIEFDHNEASSFNSALRRDNFEKALVSLKDVDSNPIDFNLVPEEVPTVFAKGYNRIPNNQFAKNETELDEHIMERSENSDLTDRQGLIHAIGYHRLGNDKYTYFVHAQEGTNLLATATTLTLTIDGVAYTLTKQDADPPQSVEFRMAADDELEAEPVLEDSSTISIDIEGTAYEFVPEETTHRDSKVYANCAIFELGMPSPAQIGSTRVIGGNNYDLKENVIDTVYQGHDLNIKDAANITQDVVLANGDRLHYLFDEEQHLANNPTKTLINPRTPEVARLLSQANYLSGVFSQQNSEVIYEYLKFKDTNLAIFDSDQGEILSDYLNGGAALTTTAVYTQEIVDLDGDAIDIEHIKRSFNGTEIYAVTNKGIYNATFNSPNPITLSAKRTAQVKPIVFNNKIAYVSKNNQFIIQALSRERLGYEVKYSGTAQQHLIRDIKDLIYDIDYDIYLALREDGKVVCATDFDKDIEGYALWELEGINILKLLNAGGNIKALAEYNNNHIILEFDFNLGVDLEGSTPTPFESQVVLNPYIDNSTDLSVNKAHISKVSIVADNIGDLLVGYKLGDQIYKMKPYARINEKTNEKSIIPFDINTAMGYNVRLVMRQMDNRADTIIYGVNLKGGTSR